MQQGQLNWADLNGLFALVLGVVGGATGAVRRGADWPLVVVFAICGFGVGFVSAKSIGRVAYACLNREDISVWFTLGYMVIPPAMPMVAGLVSYLIPAVALARGAA